MNYYNVSIIVIISLNQNLAIIYMLIEYYVNHAIISITQTIIKEKKNSVYIPFERGELLYVISM